MSLVFRRAPGLLSLAAPLLAVVVCAAAPRASRPAALPAARTEAIERIVEAERKRLDIPGLSAAVAIDLRPAWSEGFGMADLENSVPARAGTVYRLASLSKPITAVAVLQLVERGKLDLDAPIQKYVPSFPEKPWPITPRELLAHLSGIRHYRTLEEAQNTRHYSDLREPLRHFQDDPLLFEPGTRFLYTTYGYSLLGAAVETAAGAKFLDYLRENIFKPAGMETVQQDDVYRIVPHRARGYRRNGSGEIQNCALSDTSNKIPGGGLVSTAEDLVRFAVALDRGLLLRRETLEEMFTRQKLRDGRLGPYGLGWQIDRRGGRTWISHSGGQPGVSTFLLTTPKEGMAVAVMANLEGVDLVPLSVRIADVLLQSSPLTVDPPDRLR